MRIFLSLLCVMAMAPAVADDAGAATLEARRGAAREALELAERGPAPLAEQRLRALADHPLHPWLEYARLRRDLGNHNAVAVRAFLRRHDGQPVAGLLRAAWLDALIERKQWRDLLADWRDTGKLAHRCALQHARVQLGTVNAAALDEIAALYLHGQSLPALCDAPIAALQSHHRLTPELRWRRLMLAAEAGELGLARHLARGLPADASALAQDYVAFLETPHTRAAQWPKNERSRRIGVLGLSRLARRAPDPAETLLAGLAGPLALGEAEQGAVRYQIALWTVASYGAESARRLAAVPASAYDERLHEWRVREALARRDDAAALTAIAAMSEAQRRDARWRYFEARLRERNGEPETARALYAEAARDASFHGFLAADRAGQPYALCPRSPATPADIAAEVAANAHLVRAIELFELDRPGWAELEWRAALAGFDDTRRVEAVRLARRAGWHDRAVFHLGKQPDELKLYRLRFPLGYASTIRELAKKHDLDPAVIAAEIRAESSWMPKARSGADARGLMQVLPATGRALARQEDVAWVGDATLYRPLSNLRLGTAYLRQMLDRHGGRYYVAMAAYNAGPAPVQRWLAQRPGLDPDLWIETIPYKETRDYVARVLAFSVIYDWRLGQKATPVGERMNGRRVDDARRRAFACTVPAEEPIAP